MKTKRILAASTAALLAFGSTAAYVASAAETGVEGVNMWTIDGSKAGDEKVQSATVNPYFEVKIPDAIYNTWVDSTNKTIIKTGDTYDYTKELNLALWESTKDYKFTEFNGGTAELEMKGTAVDWVPAKIIMANAAGDKFYAVDSGSNALCPKVMVPTLADGAVIVLTAYDDAEAGDITDQKTTVQYAIVAKADAEKYAAGVDTEPTLTGTAVAAAGATHVYLSSATSGALKGKYVFGDSAAATQAVVSKDVSGKQTVNIGKEFRDAAGNVGATVPENAKYGLQTATVQLTPKFDGLSDTTKLVAISKDSKITVDVSGKVNGATWTKYYYDTTNKANLWSIFGTKDYTWSWLATNGAGNWDPTANNTTGFQILLGYPGATGVTVNAQVPTSLKTAPTTDKDKDDLYIPNQLNWTPISGSTINLGFGNLVPPAVLKALNDGGTITFEFDRELKGTEYFTGAIVFGGNNGAIANNVAVEAAYGNGKTATVTIPAGLTYYADEKNPWQSVGIGWDFKFEKLGQGLLTSLPSGEDKNVTDVHIVKMTFAAKGVVAPNGTTSGSTSGSTGTSGSNSGSSTASPNTGIALAIAPVVLAAGAVAVVALKKKH